MTAREPDPSSDDVVEEGLFSHLIELRSRLLRAIVVLLLVLLALVPVANHLYAELARPLVERMPQGAHLIATEVASPFVTPLKLAFFVALFISMPMILYQLWAFVSPGLYRHEKRLARPLLVASLVLFYSGCAFAYFIVLPAALPEIMAGCRTGLVLALITMVTSEMIARQNGAGNILFNALDMAQYDTVFAMIIVIGTLGIIFDAAFEKFRRALVRWSEPRFDMPLSFS